MAGQTAAIRHHFHPFIEGVSERTYTDEQLANIDPPPFEYQGKTYTAYESTQKQRQIERTIRKLKRERAAYEQAGLTEDAQDVSIRIRRLNAEYKAFSKAAGLPEQPERMKVYDADFWGAKENSKNLYDETAINPVVRKTQYRNLFNNLNESPKVQRAVYQESKSMLIHRSGTKYEDLSFVDSVTGKCLKRTDYNVENEVLPNKKMRNMVKDSATHTIIAIHNHSGNTVPSMADIYSAYKNKYKYGLIACHNGYVFKYAVMGSYDPFNVNVILDKINRILYNPKGVSLNALSNALEDLQNRENILLEVFGLEL